MNMRLGFFPYNGMNYKAAQAWLDRKAKQGWALNHVYLGSIAHLQRAETPSHFVDLDIRSVFDGETDADYLQLCSDAGWELVQQLRGMLLFRAAERKSPAPIQTDGELEWERFWERYRPRLWSTLFLLAVIGFTALILALPSRGIQTQNFTARLAISSSLLYLLYLLLGVTYIVLQWAHSTWYLARCRRSGQVEDPGPLATFLDSLARLQTPILLLCLLFSMVQLFAGRTVDLDLSPISNEYTATVEACQEWPVVMARDLGLPDSKNSRHLEGFRSVLMDFLKYSELTDGEGPDTPLHILTTERYDCVTETLAKWVIGWRREETRNGAFLWGGLDWIKIGAGPCLVFDECYACRDGSYLLFRQGRLVVLVGCSDLDLTNPSNLEIIRTRTMAVP